MTTTHAPQGLVSHYYVSGFCEAANNRVKPVNRPTCYAAGVSGVCEGSRSAMMPAAQGPIQIERSTDQGEMGEGLRKVA